MCIEVYLMYASKSEVHKRDEQKKTTNSTHNKQSERNLALAQEVSLQNKNFHHYISDSINLVCRFVISLLLSFFSSSTLENQLKSNRHKAFYR